MEFDKTWLNDLTISGAGNELVFYFDSLKAEDEISVRLRSEIVNFLKNTITTSREKANVIFSVGNTGFDSDDAFYIKSTGGITTISGNTTTSILYGFYTLLRRRATGDDLNDYFTSPSQPIRMINHWDQTDGSIERGYAGQSIFFGKAGDTENWDFGTFSTREIDGSPFRNAYDRVEFYARMLASLGMNAVSINNVNARGRAAELLKDDSLEKVSEIAKIFSGFGIKTFLAINWSAPKKLGGLSTSDPLDESVISWWEKTTKSIYRIIPNFGGFIVKADSEGEPGPYQYGRDHAQGSNMLADAIRPYGGLIIWRTFVYNAQQNWRDRSTDRAKAASENFLPLDGKFADNVILQIKFGPMDFQVREPLAPLFGALRHTNVMMEFQVTAEYLGHQIDINYSAPQWKEMIDTDTKHININGSQVKNIIHETAVNSNHTGFAAVGNVGMDDNWTGNKLAQANLYAFGRLCWDNEISSEKILKEWITQSFIESSEVTRQTIFDIMITSNETYENYCAPLGVGFMVNPHYHYGVSVNGYEYDRWGTYHFADRNGVGVDRTSKTGTGYAALYSKEKANMYENIETMPDELILFFHHVPYTHVLHSGKTVIQHIYDTHFAGYSKVQEYIEQWATVEGDVDDLIFKNVADRLQLQKQNAVEWRDQINTYFFRMSGIADERGRNIFA